MAISTVVVLQVSDRKRVFGALDPDLTLLELVTALSSRGILSRFCALVAIANLTTDKGVTLLLLSRGLRTSGSCKFTLRTFLPALTPVLSTNQSCRMVTRFH